MKKILLLLILFSFFTKLTAQWVTQSSPVTSTLTSVFLTDTLNGWAVGNSGTILKYKNGQWIQFESPTLNNLSSVFFLDSLTGWAVGYNGTIIRYSQGNWEIDTSNTTYDLTSVCFNNSTDGWAVGDVGTILHYNGTSWTSQQSGIQDNLYEVKFLVSTGWIVGAQGIILKYSNSIWSYQSSGTSAFLLSVDFSDNNNVIAVGGQMFVGGVLLKYNGSSWINQGNVSDDFLRSVDVFDNTTSWAVGDGGAIIKQNGSIYSQQNSPTTSTLNSVFFTDQNYGWAVGSNGAIISTKNGGEIPPSPEINVSPTSLDFGNLHVGEDTVLSYSLVADHLQSDILIHAPEAYTIALSGILIYDTSLIILKGTGTINETIFVKFSPKVLQNYYSQILHESTGIETKELNVYGIGGNLGIDDQQDKIVSLQIYPNPFSKKTNIYFKILSKTKVIVNIMDAMGKLICKLINDENQPGTYELNFVPDAISRGTYYCQIITDSEVLIRKIFYTP